MTTQPSLKCHDKARKKPRLVRFQTIIEDVARLTCCSHDVVLYIGQMLHHHLIADELSLKPMTELPGLADRVDFMIFIRLSG